MSTLDPQLARQLEQVRRDFAKAFRVLKESRTLTATNTYQAYVRVPDSDKVIAVHAPNPWADDQEIRAVVATYDGEVILDESVPGATPLSGRGAGGSGHFGETEPFLCHNEQGSVPRG